ncbi:MAG: ribonuclease HII [Desulfovibrionaceae bacterium]|nr:ribonuclease HII [Desulfovibrionaceae bacterium]
MAGIDEVGRGALAGPVVAAAVILPNDAKIADLDDSKRLSVKKREELATLIRKTAVAWSIGLVGQHTIDKINILQSTFLAMAMSAARLPGQVNLLQIDGNKIIPAGILKRIWQKHKEAPIPRQQAYVHGDASIAAISAASIIAKTYRDALMRHLAKIYPGYGLEEHFGYGTKYHLQKIQALGPSPLHRLTFRGVKVEEKKVSFVQNSLF